MKKYSSAELIKIVLDSFDAERLHDVEAGLDLVAQDFMQRSMIVSEGKLFPLFTSDNLREDLEAAYAVEGRQFHVWNVAANEETQTVFVELAEVEPRTEKDAVWPYVLVCKIENGRIKRSRHYGDPSTLRQNLSIDQVRTVVED